MKIYTDLIQGSDEWKQLRLGKITASKMKDLLSKGRGSAPSKMAETYMFELIAERLTGESKPFFENDAMRWGTETEDQARAMYEINEDVIVQEVAFIELNENVGVSPDGLIGEDGMLEIKCPNTTTQLKRALTGDYSQDYYAQIQMQLWVADRLWCDFLSFDPRLDCDAGYLLERVEIDLDFTSNMAVKVKQFIENMQEKIDVLTIK